MALKKTRDIQKDFYDWGDRVCSSLLPKYDDLPTLDLYMDQVIVLLEEYLVNFVSDDKDKIITSSMINNYVKHGMIPAPIRKKYNRKHLVYLIIICIMKPIISINIIHDMIEEQLQENRIEEILDIFVDKYNTSIRTIYENAKKIISDGGTSKNMDVIMGNLAINMALSASISKLIADNTLYTKSKSDKEIDKK